MVLVAETSAFWQELLGRLVPVKITDAFSFLDA
jgi:hypothetical protein